MQLTAIILNFIYAILGGILTLLFMHFGYKWFDRFTDFNTSEELSKDNKAVGLVVMGIFIGIGIAVGMVIGLGLN